MSNTRVSPSSGIDVNIVDKKGLTALDTVKDMPSQKSREIAALILGEGPDCENPTKLQRGSFFSLVLTLCLFVYRRSHDWKTPRYRAPPAAGPPTPGEPQPPEKE